MALSLDDEELLSEALALRIHHGLKLPDAITGATALTRNALLVTNDTHFTAIPNLAVQGCYSHFTKRVVIEPENILLNRLGRSTLL